MNEKKLNVGSGEDIRKGWINLDQHSKHGAEVVFDLNDIYKGKKLPLEDNSVDYIYCNHVLEDFLEPVPILNEFVRVCKKGGKIEIRTPFETHNWNTNIFHKRPFTLGQLIHYTELSPYGHKKELKVVESKYYCRRSPNPLKRLFQITIENFYNLFPYKFVEGTFLKYLFPIINCKVVYKKL